jgi:hypothetical protein
MVAQISLILFILNLVLAAPTVVQEIHEARGDGMVVAEDVAAMPKKWTRWHLRSIRRTGRCLRAMPILPRIRRRKSRLQAIRGCWTGRSI